MTGPALLAVRGLTKSFHGRPIVDDVTFAVPEGSITALVGRNGAGKSTVMRMLVGLVRPDAGVSTFAGSVHHQLRHPAQHVGAALDASAVHPGRSVQETVRLAAALAGVTRRRADDCLLEVGLDGARRTLVGSLSLGMRQRLSLAVALLGEPALFVLDEPANGLDPRWREWLDRYLERHRDAGGGVLVSSHELGWPKASRTRSSSWSRGVSPTPARRRSIVERPPSPVPTTPCSPAGWSWPACPCAASEVCSASPRSLAGSSSWLRSAGSRWTTSLGPPEQGLNDC